MVVVASHKISRVPRYSGTYPAVLMISPTGLSPSMAPLSRGFDYQERLYLPLQGATWTGRSSNPTAATSARYALQWFRLFRFRSPLLTESLVLSVLRGTEMFHFPRFPLLPYVFSQESPTCVGDVAPFGNPRINVCLLYTSDAADDLLCVDLGGRRII